MDIALRDNHRRRLQALQHIAVPTQLGHNHLPHTGADIVLLHDQQPPGLAHRCRHRLTIPRRNGTQINQFNIQLRTHRCQCLFRQLHTIAPGHQRQQPTLAHRARTPEWNGINRSRCGQLGPHQVLGQQNDRRVFPVQCRPKQSSRIAGRRRHHYTDTGHACKRGLTRLTVPQRTPGQIPATRRVNHQRTFPMPEAAPTQRRHIGDQLIPAGINKVDKLDLKTRPFAVRGQPHRNPHDGRLRQRRIDCASRVFGREPFGQIEDSAFGIRDVLAEENHIRQLIHCGMKRAVHRVQHPTRGIELNLRLGRVLNRTGQV